jgi:hypothetical protein
MADEPGGRKVAILLAPVGSEQVGFTEPEKAVEEAASFTSSRPSLWA